MKKGMKKALAVLAVAAMTMGLVACGGKSDAGKDEGGKTKLYVMNWKDYCSDNKELMKDFEEEYNCEIVNTYMESEESLLTSLKTAADGEIDVCLPNCSILPAAIEAGLLKQIDTSKIENFDKLYDRFQNQAECVGSDGNMYAVPFVWGSTAIAYNTDLVKEAPESIDVLFKDTYKGKIAFRDDFNDAVMAAAIVTGQDPTKPESLDLDLIKKTLIAQKKLNKTYWQTGDEFSKLFVGGDTAVGLMWSGQTASMRANGEHIAFTVPQDGAIGWVDNWGIAAGTKNEDLAYAFINYMISEKVQAGWATAGGPAPANQAAAENLDPEYAAACGMDEGSLNRLYFMVYLDGATKSAWNELWTEVKAN